MIERDPFLQISQNLKNKFQKSCIALPFSYMPNREETTRYLISWYILLIEPQNYIHKRQQFTRSQNLPNRITPSSKKKQGHLSGCIFKQTSWSLK